MYRKIIFVSISVLFIELGAACHLPVVTPPGSESPASGTTVSPEPSQSGSRILAPGRPVEDTLRSGPHYYRIDPPPGGAATFRLFLRAYDTAGGIGDLTMLSPEGGKLAADDFLTYEYTDWEIFKFQFVPRDRHDYYVLRVKSKHNRQMTYRIEYLIQHSTLNQELSP